MTRVVVAAEVGFYRDGLAFVLPRYEIEVAGTASTAGETVLRTIELEPDVTVLDMTMTKSIDVMRTIGVVAPAVRVVALGVSDDELELLACIEAGAAGYVMRDGTLEDVVDSIERTVRGEPLASPRVVGILMRRVAALASQSAQTPVTSLTSRERDVIELIDQGLSNKEIAARLSIEVATVKNHVHNILEKLSVRKRGEAAARVRASINLSRTQNNVSAIAG